MKIITINSARKFTGEAAHSLDLTDQLLMQGHEVLLVARKGSNLLGRASERNIAVSAELDFEGGLKYTLGDLRTLRKLIKAESPDIVHCHRGNDHGLAVAAAAGLRHRPAIIRTRHRVMAVDNDVANRWLFMRGTDMTIAVSEKAAASFGKMRDLLGEKIRVVYSSVDTEKFGPARRSTEWRTKNGVAEDEPLIGLIARLQRVKGQEQFLRAAAKVLKEFPNARFLMAGVGQVHKRPKLEQMAKQLGVFDRLVFLNWLDDVPTAVASLDVGVLASLGSEGSSRVTYEYMASGTSVVATSVGCIPEIISDGETGYIVPPRDVDALAAAIVRQLRDPEARDKMTKRALERIHTHHTRSRWVREILEVYEEALRRREDRRKWHVLKNEYARLLHLK